MRGFVFRQALNKYILLDNLKTHLFELSSKINKPFEIYIWNE